MHLAASQVSPPLSISPVISQLGRKVAEIAGVSQLPRVVMRFRKSMVRDEPFASFVCAILSPCLVSAHTSPHATTTRRELLRTVLFQHFSGIARSCS